VGFRFTDRQRRRLVKHGIPVSQATEQIVLEMAQENECWGCRTIAGELKKLGHNVCHTTVFNILNAHAIPLGPDRKALSWKKFIQSHMAVMWASVIYSCS